MALLVSSVSSRCRCIRANQMLCCNTAQMSAGVVQWQNRSFPSFGRGFDSHRPLQHSKAVTRKPHFPYFQKPQFCCHSVWKNQPSLAGRESPRCTAPSSQQGYVPSVDEAWQGSFQRTLGLIFNNSPSPNVVNRVTASQPWVLCFRSDNPRDGSFGNQNARLGIADTTYRQRRTSEGDERSSNSGVGAHY